MNEDLYLHGIGASGDVGYASSWVRPADWLPLPALTDNDNKMVALVAVHDMFNYVAVRATGAYTVDWGDGTVESFASNATAYHTYDYNNAALAATLCSRGYKQAILTLTPQAGQTLTGLFLLTPHTAPGQGYDPGFLDLEIAGAALTSLTLGSTATTPTPHYAMLERAAIHKNAVTSWSSVFAQCAALRSLPVCYTSAGTSFSFMFNGATSLPSLPALDTANGTSFSTMFSGASMLLSVPPLNTSKGTDFTSMFQNCNCLLQVPLLDTSQATAAGSMYSGCSRISTVPALNFPKATNLSNLLTGCSALLSIPDLYAPLCTTLSAAFSNCSRLATLGAFTLGACTTFTSMFNNCGSLQTAPALDTSKATGMGTMFSLCRSLTSVPAYNTKLVTDFSSLYNGCANLQKVPTLDTSAGVTFSQMYNGCASLYEVPPLTMSATSAASGLTNFVTGAYSLAKISILAGPAYSFSLANYNKFSLSAAQLEGIFETLPNVSGQTLTLSTVTAAPVALSGTTTLGSNQVTMASTAGLSVGMCATGTGLPASASQNVSVDGTQGLVNHASHGFSQNTPLVFTSIPGWQSVIAAALPSAGTWGSVAYGNGRLVATKAINSTALAVSTDGGTTWTAAALPASGIRNIAFGAGLFVVLGTGGAGASKTYYTSPDGVTWTTRSLPVAVTGQWGWIGYLNGRFTALSNFSTSPGITSTDGINWTWSAAAGGLANTSNNWESFSDGSAIYVVPGGSTTGNGYKSVDGLTWTSWPGPPSSAAYRYAYGNGTYLALDSTTTSLRAYLSKDGISWTLITHPLAAACSTLIFANGLFYAGHSLAASGSSFAVSADGLNWSFIADPAASAGWGAAIAVGDTCVMLTNQANTAVALVKAASEVKLAKTYYPVAISANSYKLAASAGGSPVTITNTGTALAATLRNGAVIDAITPNTSVTLSAPATASGTATLSFRSLQVIKAILRGWAIVN